MKGVNFNTVLLYVIVHNRSKVVPEAKNCVIRSVESFYLRLFDPGCIHFSEHRGGGSRTFVSRWWSLRVLTWRVLCDLFQ